MPTPNYTDTASDYKALFNAEGRSNASAAVTSNEQFDRDNLLHFIEKYFKTNVSGGFKLVNLRAFLHVLVKSVSMIADNKTSAILASTSIRVSSTATDRWYLGSITYGWNYFSWSQYIVGTLNENTTPNIFGSYSTMGIDVPFEIFSPRLTGTILKNSGTGDVDFIMYYTDQDDSGNTYLQNPVFIGKDTVNCAVTSTGYDINLTSAQDFKVPQGKKIFILVRNTSYSSGSDTLKISWSLSYNKRSTNYTIT